MNVKSFYSVDTHVGKTTLSYIELLKKGKNCLIDLSFHNSRLEQFIPEVKSLKYSFFDFLNNSNKNAIQGMLDKNTFVHKYSIAEDIVFDHDINKSITVIPIHLDHDRVDDFSLRWINNPWIGDIIDVVKNILSVLKDEDFDNVIIDNDNGFYKWFMPYQILSNIDAISLFVCDYNDYRINLERLFQSIKEMEKYLTIDNRSKIIVNNIKFSKKDTEIYEPCYCTNEFLNSHWYKGRKLIGVPENYMKYLLYYYTIDELEMINGRK